MKGRNFINQLFITMQVKHEVRVYGVGVAQDQSLNESVEGGKTKRLKRGSSHIGLGMHKAEILIPIESAA